MTANIFLRSSVELKQMLDPALLLIATLLSCLYCLFEQFHSLIPLLIWDHKSTCWRTNDSVWFMAWEALCTQLITELQRYLKHGEYIILTNFFICSIRRILLSSNTQWNRLFPPRAKSSGSHAHTHTHAHTHWENTACFFSYLCCWTVFLKCCWTLWYMRKNKGVGGRDTCVPWTLTNIKNL